MSTDIIADISNTIIWRLRKEINEDNNFGGIVKLQDITLFSPVSQLAHPPRLCLFLYQIVENQYMKNMPMERVGTELKYQPLVLDLHYILMPYDVGTQHHDGLTGATIEEHRLMGKAMQILYDNRQITKLKAWGNTDITQDPTVSLDIPVKLAYNPVSLDDMTKLWQSIHNSPYRPSVCYIASPVVIESGRKNMDIVPVLSVEKQYDEKKLINKEEQI